MLGAGQRETQKQKLKEPNPSPFPGGYLKPPALREEPQREEIVFSFTLNAIKL
jgi:hypothetical protein